MSTGVHGTGHDIAARGTPLSPEQMAAHTRRWGFWPVALWRLEQMRFYGWSMFAYAVGQPLLYMLAMGVGLGALVSANGRTVDGVSYLVFVAPSIMVSTVVLSASGEFSYPVMEGFRWNHLYDGPAATPVSPAQVALGHHLAVMIRFLAQALVFWFIMLSFGGAPGSWSWLSVPVTVLASSAFGAPLQAYAAGLEDDTSQFTFVQRFVVMPMTLFSGTYFPLASMPVWLQWIGWVSPIWHGTQLARDATYGAGEAGWLVAVHLVFLAGASAAGLLTATRIYARRLSQ